MRVVVAYNDDADLKTHLNAVERLGEEEVVAVAQEVAALTGGNLLPVRDVARALDQLRRNRPDVVFNLCEGVVGRPQWEMHFALALEMLGIPFTGCDPTAVGISTDKFLTKQLLKTAGLPVPEGYVVSDASPSPGASRHPLPQAGEGTPFIVKPVHEDAGIGIDADAVCTSASEVAARIEHVTRTYRQPALVEEFIDGPELNQALYFSRSGVVVLPPGEIVFAVALEPRERVVGWKAKWAEGSAEDQATANRTPAEIDDSLRHQAANLCTAAAAVLSIGGYCRFDLRQRASGELCIIDVNPNPDIGRGTGFRRALEAAGIGFGEFVDELMMTAQSRRRP